MFVDPQSYPLAKHRQGIVYGITHDVSLKIAIKNHKSPKDVMDYLPVKTDLDEIKAALETEGRTTKASDDIQADDNFDDEDDEGCRLPGGASPAAARGAPAAGMPQRPSLMERSSALSGLTPVDKKFWLAFAKRTLAAHIKLFTEPDSSSDVRDLINKSSIAKAKGIDKEDCVMILFDVKQSGECITAPHLRVPPLRDEQIGKLITGVLESRRAGDPDADALIDGDVLCMFDGGRHGPVTLQKPCHVPGRCLTACQPVAPWTYCLSDRRVPQAMRASSTNR